MALGIDAAAHRGALRAQDGRTLAVLGSGLRAIHPKRNVPLAAEIAGRGAVLSELFPDTRVRGTQLMARDRIISGLGRAIIVVEADDGGGSFDTARRGVKQGRQIWALPGSPGADALIAAGAQALDPETVDWDDLAARIAQYRPEPEPSPTQNQLTLF